MKTKINKLVKLAAAGLFIVALAINVKVTLDDPFVMISEGAVAQASSGSNSSQSGPEKTPFRLWITQGTHKDEKTLTRDCPTSQSSGVDVTIGVKVKKVTVGVNVNTTGSQVNPPTRDEIYCEDDGYTNCSSQSC